VTTDWIPILPDIWADYHNALSLEEVVKKYGLNVCPNTVYKALKRYGYSMRSYSEAIKLSHTQHPDSYRGERASQWNGGGRRLSDPGFADLFWSKTKAIDSGCLEWTGGLRDGDYGEIFVDGKQQAVHRVAWQLAYGKLEDAICVLHSCDNPPCVKLDHLFTGTVGDNNRDRAAKGRSNHVVPTGEKSSVHKLTTSQVSKIKSALLLGVGTSELGRRYGVSHMTINSIRRGITWRDIPADAAQETCKMVK
jgi:hypothetical protein